MAYRDDTAKESITSLGSLAGAARYDAQCNTQAEPPAYAPTIGYENRHIVAHHSPDRDQIQRITAIRQAALNFLDVIDANCPRCADATAAKRKVREAMMTANAAIVLNGSI